MRRVADGNYGEDDGSEKRIPKTFRGRSFEKKGRGRRTRPSLVKRKMPCAKKKNKKIDRPGKMVKTTVGGARSEKLSSYHWPQKPD